MCFGFPLRTRNTMVEVYGALLSGRLFCQSAGSNFPCSAIASISYARASVTTSASSPWMTDWADLPDPEWDWETTTLSPVLSFQYLAKAALYCWYNSRVGSY